MDIDSMVNVLKTQQPDTTKANTLLLISANLYQTGKTEEALPYLKQLVDLAEELKFNNGLRLGYFFMTLIYDSKSDYLSVLDNAYKGLEVFRETGDS